MDLQEVKFEGWPHVLKAQQFNRRWLKKILFPLADRMETLYQHRMCSNMLAEKEMISLFCGESTRTRASFEIAMQRLGGRVIFSSPSARFSSSMGKDESFDDTILVLDEYGGDALTVRNDGKEELEKIVSSVGIPVINAADNAEKDRQHPSQALLDVYTIQRHRGRIDGLRVAMVGDLSGRTVRSNCYLLGGKFEGIEIFFVSPVHHRVGDDIKEYLSRHGVTFHEETDVRKVAPHVDVIYQTRTQKNLGTAVWDRTDESHGFTVIDRQVLDLMKPDAIIMHPLPCIDEIVRSEVDPDPRAIYIKSKNGKPSQVKCGLWVRMALLLNVISPEACCLML